MEYAGGLILLLLGYGLWKGFSWAGDKLTAPKGYALVAVTTVGIVVLPIASDASSGARTEALRSSRQALTYRWDDAAPYEGETLVPEPTRDQQYQATKVKLQLEANGYEVEVVDAKFLEASLETEDAADDQSLFPERRSIREGGRDSRVLVVDPSRHSAGRPSSPIGIMVQPLRRRVRVSSGKREKTGGSLSSSIAGSTESASAQAR